MLWWVKNHINNWAIAMRRGGDHSSHRKPLQDVSSSFCILATIQQWRSEGRIAAWLHIPILQSHFIAPAASLGFCFHHTDPHSSTLTLWLGEGPSRLPGYATHQVGVAGQFRPPHHRNCLCTGLLCLLEAGLLVC